MTIQEIMEITLGKALRQKITCIGCGRTDAHVNASQFFFHFDFENQWDFDLKFRINKMLPDDIAIFDIIPLEKHYHAQLDATSREYTYLIHTQKSPLISELSSFYPHNFNIPLMQEATKLLTKFDDYKNLCLCPSHQENTICKVESAILLVSSNGRYLQVKITANRFIQGMVRIIVQMLMDIGTGKLSVTDFEDYLTCRKAPQEVKRSYPQGLYLSKITYPFLDIKPNSIEASMF